MKQIRKRLTYANVMSSLAVFMVLGGATAFAATKIGANQLKANSVKTGKIVKEAVTEGKIKNGAVTTNKIADKAVTGPKIDAATLGPVPNATNAVNASHAKTADTAKLAEEAITADSVFAFARVEENGTVLPALAFNIVSSDVTNPTTGVYCFDLPFDPSGVQVTNEVDSDNDEVLSAVDEQSPDGLINCPAGTEVEVTMFDVGTPGLENGDFYIELYL